MCTVVNCLEISLDLVVVKDTHDFDYDEDENIKLIQQIFDGIVSRSKQTVRASLIVADHRTNGQATLVHPLDNILVNLKSLKQSTLYQPTFYDYDLRSLVGQVLGTVFNRPDARALLFLCSAASVQYVMDTVKVARKIFPDINVFAVTRSGVDAKMYSKVTGSMKNVFLSPDAKEVVSRFIALIENENQPTVVTLNKRKTL